MITVTNENSELEKILKESDESCTHRKSRNCSQKIKFGLLLKLLCGLMLIACVFSIVWFLKGLFETRDKVPLTKHGIVTRIKDNGTIKHESIIDIKKLSHSNKNLNPTINGKWNSIKVENFDPYLQSLGISFFKRKFGVLGKPSMSISRNGQKLYIVWINKLPVGVTVSSIMNCTDGVEFDYTSPDESKYRTTIRSDGARRIIQEDRDPISKRIKGTAVSEVNDNDQLIVILRAGNVTAKVTYERVEE